MRPTCILVLTTAVLSQACGGGVDLPMPTSIEVVAATNGQEGYAGGRLSLPLAVIARAADATIVPRARVQWTVTGGSGAVLSDAVTLADGTGQAQVELTLGPAVGDYAVRAALAVNTGVMVMFTARALDPPLFTEIVPSTFQGGDTISLVGARLSTTLRPEIGGALGTVVRVSAAADTLRAIVPRCLVPGSVNVRLVTDLWQSGMVTGTFQATGGPVTLRVGEYVSLDPVQLNNCATFPDAGVSTVEYLLTPQSVAGVPGASGAYRLRGDSFTTMIPAPQRRAAPPLWADRFHTFLREREAEYGRLPPGPLRAARVEAVAAATKVGDRRNFRVCNVVTCSKLEDFTSITAEAKYVGRHAVIYQDLTAPTGGFTQTDFTDLGKLFDEELYEVNARAFGAESDVDQDGLVSILLTPVVNRLTPKAQCDQSFITGFFFALDVDSRFSNDNRSNQAEVFYAITPDPTGSVTCSHATDRVRRLVPVTFVHEHQHMINYNQHVLARTGGSEVVWLNEALSHLAEELAALHFQAQGDQTRFSRFAINDIFNAFLYLKNPEPEWVVFGDGTGSLEERGAVWLFLRWLVDQKGDALARRLVETSTVGAQNIEAATGEPIARLLADWFLTNWVSDLPGFTPPPRLTYATWRFRTTYQSLNQQDPTTFDRPFPIVPQTFMGGTFEATGTLRSGSGAYFRVLQSPGQRGFTVTFDDGAGGPITATVVPRLNVLRIQ